MVIIKLSIAVYTRHHQCCHHLPYTSFQPVLASPRQMFDTITTVNTTAAVSKETSSSPTRFPIQYHCHQYSHFTYSSIAVSSITLLINITTRTVQLVPSYNQHRHITASSAFNLPRSPSTAIKGRPTQSRDPTQYQGRPTQYQGRPTKSNAWSASSRVSGIVPSAHLNHPQNQIVQNVRQKKKSRKIAVKHQTPPHATRTTEERPGRDSCVNPLQYCKQRQSATPADCI